MRKFVDLSGQKFGRWTAEKFIGYRKPHQMWACRCECGSVAEVASICLRNGSSQSCGCLRIERASQANKLHGGTEGCKSVEYETWARMVARCTNANNKDYTRYGGRGIKVCDRWLYGELDKSGFACFLSDMGSKPFSRATIERNNNDGDYGPGNCRWADRRAQSRNRSNNVSVVLRGRGMLLKDALTELGASTSSYYYLKRLGYPTQLAIDRMAGIYNGPPPSS